MERTGFTAPNHTLQEICEPKGHMRVSMNESTVKVCKSKENLDVMERFWRGPFYNTADPLRVRTDTFCTDKESEKLDFLDVKLAFAQFAKQIILTQPGKYLTDVFMVLVFIA